MTEKTDEELIDDLLAEVGRAAGTWGFASYHSAKRMALSARMAALHSTLDATYSERNRLVAALAKLFPSGLKKTAIEGWDPEWHNCVYIDLPSGQASWHYHVNDRDLFEGLPPYVGDWDGHTTPEKYQRLAALTQQVKP